MLLVPAIVRKPRKTAVMIDVTLMTWKVLVMQRP